MMDNFLYFDIETIPSQSPEYAAKVAETITAPATYKKPESIEKWLDENRESAAAEKVAKTSFDGGRGHVVSIAWAYNDGKLRHASAHTVDHECHAIRCFFDAMDDYHSTTLVGHYIHGFDIPFLTQRAVALGVKLPPPNIWPRDPKPWSDRIHDTMVMWAGSKGRISMDELCDILGIPGKGDFDGSMVADAWLNGEHDKIDEYCRADVERTREIHRRFIAAGW